MIIFVDKNLDSDIINEKICNQDQKVESIYKAIFLTFISIIFELLFSKEEKKIDFDFIFGKILIFCAFYALFEWRE